MIKLVKRPLTRRTFIKSSLIIGTAAIISESFYFGRYRISISKHRISLKERPQNPILKVIQISDLHIQSISGFYIDVANKINSLKPDILFITGDSIDQPGKLNILNDFLSLLDKNSKKYSILGNWEHWGKIDIHKLSKVYYHHGCKLLINETSKVILNNRVILITGLDDSTGGYPNIEHALKNIDPEKNHFLLAHSPQFVDTIYSRSVNSFLNSTKTSKTKIQDFQISTVFSGHTHGGQISFFGFAPFRPRGSGQYVNGWYDVNGIKMYVNRGIGTSVIPARFMATPEISYFEYSLN